MLKKGVKMSNLEEEKSGSILLAIDGSQSAKSAAYAAIQIASAMKWSIQAQNIVDSVQVFEPYVDPNLELMQVGTNVFTSEQKVTLFKEQGRHALAEIEDLCRDMNVPIKTEMILGDPGGIILEAAKEHRLLALGRRGNRHEENRHHLGSNFRRIAHHSPVPLLIGGNDVSQQDFLRVLLAYDGSELSRKSLGWMELLQGIFKDTVILSVEEDEQDSSWLAGRRDEIKNSNLKSCEFVSEFGSPAETIAAVASSRQADLIVMGSYHHSQFLEWARHSTLSTVLQETNIPVLAIK
jgi:nucleotide-binding universal stress UspA family protein